MQLFMLKNRYGVAIVSAQDQKEGLKQLKQHEDHALFKSYLTLGINAEDFRPISPEAPGILLYIVNN